MRVLLINKFLRPVGGSETVFFNEWRWLEEAGHEIIPFGMAHPRNVASPYGDYWAAAVDYDHPSPAQLLSLFWSPQAARQLSRLLAIARPDVAHLHNIYHQLSPSIIAALRQAGIPTLLTLHDYKLICPNYRLYTQGQRCTRCVQSHPWHALGHRCMKNSLPASALAALETALHRGLGAYAGIDHFIAPSQFMKQMMCRGGWPPEQITALSHAIDPPPASQKGSSASAILFTGRLVAEKGVDLLLAAAARLPAIPFRLAGDGPLRKQLAAGAPLNVTWLGHLTAAELAVEYAAARAVVVPSRWYEVFGMSALEAMSHGVPVVASNLGGLAELIMPGETGLLFPPGNVEALTAAVRQMWHNPDQGAQMGRTARAYTRRHHAPATHLEALLELYTQLRGGHRVTA